MRKALATIGVVSAFAAGCGGAPKPTSEHGPVSPGSKPSVTTSQRPKIDVYHGKATPPRNILALMKHDPMLNSLNHFRERIIEQRKARVLLGVCATWPNVSGGFTATINPGTAEFRTKQGVRVSYLIFSAYNVQDPSALQEMNGPQTVEHPDRTFRSNDQNLGLEFYRKDHSARSAYVDLSDQPIIDQAGREYFKDRADGEPIMLTGLAPTADYSAANIQAACHALLHHQLLPGILVS